MESILAVVGFEIPAFSDHFVRFDSYGSLLRADVIVATPYAPPIHDEQLQQMVAMRKEITTATAQGGLSVFFMSEYKPSYNLDPNLPNEDFLQWHNYCFLPIPAFRQQTGTDIQLAKSSLFIPFWKLMRPYFKYEVIFKNPFQKLLGINQKKDVIAGLSKYGKGHVLFLPSITLICEQLYDDQNEEWRQTALDLSVQMVSFLMQLASLLKEKDMEIFDAVA